MNRRFPKLKTTVTDIFDRFSDEKTCCDFLFGVRFANGFACPYCGDSRFGKIESRGLYRCKGCRKQISPTSGTFMHGTHIKLRIWIIAAYLFMTDKGGMSAVNMMRKLGVTYKTAWYLLFIAIQENICIKISREKFTVQGKRPQEGCRPSREFDAVM